MRWMNLLCLVCVLVGGPLLVVAANPPAPALPLSDQEFDDLTNRATETIRQALAHDRPKSEDVERAKAAAALLAATAQFSETPQNVAQRSARRGVALALTAALTQGNITASRDLAKALEKPSANPTPGQVVLGKTIDFSDLMESLNSFGTAKKLNALISKNGPLPAKVLTPELQMIGWQVATMGELSKSHMNKKVAKAPAAWATFAEGMRQSGQELAAAVQAKDGKAARTALDHLDANCQGCHQKFK